MRPLLIVVSAPSGAGKTTLCNRLLARRKDIVYSVSCTTRPPRGDEADGRDYHFLTDREFERRRQNGELLEHACVHGHRYGTPRAPVAENLAQGLSVLMDIDVHGARQVRAAVAAAPAGDPLKAALVDIFIEPPSLAVLRDRLERRGEDSADAIARRLRNAAEEMRHRSEFRYRVVNRKLATAAAELNDIVRREQAQAVRDSTGFLPSRD